MIVWPQYWAYSVGQHGRQSRHHCPQDVASSQVYSSHRIANSKRILALFHAFPLAESNSLHRSLTPPHAPDRRSLASTCARLADAATYDLKTASRRS